MSLFLLKLEGRDKGIQAESGTEIDIEDGGTVHIYAYN